MRLVFRKNSLSPKKTIEETNNKYNQKNKRKEKKNDTVYVGFLMFGIFMFRVCGFLCLDIQV